MALANYSASDQKRTARGEHLLRAKYFLQARDGKHNGLWTILMLAGPEPEGEIGAYRNLFPNAAIMAIDINQDCLNAAQQAGADQVLRFDLRPDENCDISQHHARLQTLGRFDIVNLDLYANCNEATRKLLIWNEPLVATGGIYLITFSLGRDVVPVFLEALEKRHRHEQWKYKSSPILNFFNNEEIPIGIKARVSYLLSRTKLEKLDSIIQYQGTTQPMCALLVGGRKTREIRYTKLCADDFANVVLDGLSPSLIYDCPADRITFLRRSRAAQKAVATKRTQSAISPEHQHQQKDSGLLIYQN